MAGRQVSLIGIKRIFYGEPLTSIITPYVNGDASTGLSADELKTWLATAKEVSNVHQDTWGYERTEPTITKYKNQLTKKVYRQSVDDAGEATISFSVGKYDFQTKADLEGGGATDGKYSAPVGFEELVKMVVGLTEDDVYIVFPKANMVTNGTTTDDAIALAVAATPMEPDIAIESEVLFDKSAIDAA